MQLGLKYWDWFFENYVDDFFVDWGKADGL
jgi:hypothetical protein